MAKTKPRYACHELIAVLRIMGHKDVANALKKVTPIQLAPNYITQHSNTQYLHKNNHHKMLKNTPLYAQLDLIAWNKLGPYLKLTATTFKLTYDSLKALAND